MKQLAGDFAGHQFWSPNNSRFELRLIAEPIHRYRDEVNGIVDAAVFLMNHEIEPEVIILIEAVKKEEKLSWQYAVTPIGSAEFHILFRGEEIYRRDREYGGSTKTHCYFSSNAKRD